MLASETTIEVIGISKDGRAWKFVMTVSQWLALKKKKGFVYKAYQLGYSQFALENS